MKANIQNLQRVEYGKSSNGNLRILGVLHDIDDYVLLEKPSRFYKICYCKDTGYGEMYFRKGGVRYYLQDFFKEN